MTLRHFAFRTLLLVCLTLILGACKPGVPGDVISESKMEDVLCDYHMAQCIAEAGDSFEVRRYGYVQAVFRKHGITEEEFDRSMVWYSSHAEFLKGIYDRIDARFEAQAAALGIGRGPVDRYANLSNQGDTANIWSGARFFALRPDMWNNRMQFNMPADTTFLPGDAFMWRFMPSFLYKDGSREGHAALMVRFTNDSVAATTQRFGGNYYVELRVRTMEKDTVKSVSGFVYIPGADGVTTYRMVALTNLSLIRFHKVKPKPKMSPEKAALEQSPAAIPLEETAPSVPGRRLSPRELREETQPTERTINVVKEKPYRVTRRRGAR